MIVRIRRYRIFLLALFVSILGLYFLADSRGWSTHLTGTSAPFTRTADTQAVFGAPGDEKAYKQTADLDGQTTERLHSAPAQDGLEDDSFPRIKLPAPDASEQSEPVMQALTPPKIHPNAPAKLPLANGPKFAEDHVAEGVAAKVTSTEPSPTPHVIRWSSQAEMFPVSSTIQLPTGKSTPIPRVQAAFGNEDPATQKSREKRQDAVKAAMKKHWAGYKKFAWGHDELQPVSQTFKDPFAGWGATLVDSLDTLWIMGMKDEFEEAVQATAKIDFTTTELKHELPLFEVTIRYLGGLLAAYDLSGAKYPLLLKKAIELGEILYGAFDTENRMPITYFKWQPENVKLYHKAGASVVLAELGTLSMEFTRLAQLSREPKYYDAVARVTDAFYEMQNRTSLPGMWPLQVDATGCSRTSSGLAAKVGNKKTNWGGALPKTPSSPPPGDFSSQLAHTGDSSTRNAAPAENDSATPTVPDTLAHIADTKAKELAKEVAMTDMLDKRAVDDNADDILVDQCERTGLQSASYSGDTFTLGGMADSVYEYLPKEYLLLGVGNSQYREMYEAAVEPIKEYTVYRPMIEDEKRNIRFTGKFTTSSESDVDEDGKRPGTLDTNTGHLACFVGGMVGLGAKLFDRPKELELAEQLTDGCVWAYEATATGIMAEDLSPVACDSMQSCKWNETKWHEQIDPYAVIQLAREWELYYELLEEQAGGAANETSEARTPSDTRKTILEPLELPIPPKKFSDFDRRQLSEQALEEFTGSAEDVAVDTIPAKSSSSSRRVSTSVSAPAAPTPTPPSTLAEHVAKIIEQRRLTPGITRWGGRNYILRPEAIESVFYMYRITGDKKWQDKGWKMWQAIDKQTSVDNGNSAIFDVTINPAVHMDAAESFWSGETLKYFYLLYSDPGLVSLDDYVFNTEAHPFLRPDAKIKKT